LEFQPIVFSKPCCDVAAAVMSGCQTPGRFSVHITWGNPLKASTGRRVPIQLCRTTQCRRFPLASLFRVSNQLQAITAERLSSASGRLGLAIEALRQGFFHGLLFSEILPPG